ncbi:MAG: hypothetical protein B6D77_08945 [gamma proteobacterium symbiont of Ctena orbiculata]|uniref:hypothetical protein n=1 Tax=Candidatus Thiodiazotropha sp. CDECU1 TaxID=3065865 RepID=UPI000D5708AA|nr:hypothetical protein [Candidatus Thiodiazotropha sp. CDECU1]PVV10028.1 MAG: hypothetical protein B6D77_08945 [gamma proteobacterium symbiont of Ctena orbiculata]PVV20381.1 MAG: hypothetical protein B6D78_10660 [gamma proteobacterium symbiont of Ctena orbiculata]PVV27589.1 MAG: hypothetical protein B6D79_01635 [gamma proteobacterium symbiont of Ctena orbiculata]
MLSLLKCKCLLGYLWTSAITAGLLSIIFFTFVDPMSVATLLRLESDSALFEVQVYASVFVFIWFTLNASTYLSHYFGQLLKTLEQEEKQQQERESKAVSSTHIEVS